MFYYVNFNNNLNIFLKTSSFLNSTYNNLLVEFYYFKIETDLFEEVICHPKLFFCIIVWHYFNELFFEIQAFMVNIK